MSETLSVEQLSARTGVTVRTIRLYQTEGLLPGPERQGRTSRYRAEHVARLDAVRELRAQGLSLPRIRQVFDDAPDATSADLRGLVATLLDLFTDEAPTRMTGRELAATWGPQVTPELAARTFATGLYEPQEDGTIEVVSPTLEQVARELAELGVPLEAVLEMQASLMTRLREVARDHVRLFEEHVTGPLLEQEGPPALEAALRRSRPLGLRATNAAMSLVLRAEVAAALARALGDGR